MLLIELSDKFVVDVAAVVEAATEVTFELLVVVVDVDRLFKFEFDDVVVVNGVFIS